jgi:hypothetical protein
MKRFDPRFAKYSKKNPDRASRLDCVTLHTERTQLLSGGTANGHKHAV